MARRITVDIVGDARSLERAFKRGARAGRGFDLSISGLGKSLAGSVTAMAGVSIGAAAVGIALKTSVDAASNLAEQTNKVNVVFGKSGKEITEWGRTTATAFGIANDQALEAAGTFGNLFHTVGVLPRVNAEMSRSLVQLAADLASFNNTDPSDALEAIRSGIIGEAEPMRRYGVLLSETRVQQEALRATGKKLTSQLSNQDKVLARVALIFKDTTTAQGDFSRTQDGLANATRQLKAELRDMEAVIGAALLPTVQDITIKLRDWLGDTENQAKIQRTLNGIIKTTGQVFHGLAIAFKVAKFAAGPFITEMQRLVGIGRSLVSVFKAVKGVLGGVAGRLGIGGGFSTLDFVSSKSGQDTSDRQPGRSPSGPGAFALPATVAAAAAGGHASLRYQLSLLELKLAKDALTASKMDDRADLVRKAALLRQLIGKTKSLKERTKLYQELGSTESQIAQIDEDKTKKADAARKKQLDARKKEAAAAKAHAAALKAAMDKVSSAFKDAVETARSGIGELFQGPVLAATEAQKKQLLGVPAVSSKTLLSDLTGQIAAFKRFQTDLAKLGKRGAPQQLLKELRAQGVSATPQIEALLSGDKGTLKAYFNQFRRRERLAVRTARMDVHAQRVVISGSKQPIVIHLDMDGRTVAKVVTVHQDKAKGKTSSQTRGRHGGR